MKTLIVGVGNRLVAEDALGCLVYDWLVQHPLPPDVELLEGGLRGLDLLPCLEGRQRVIFADALIMPVAGVHCLPGAEVAALATSYGHNAGLPFLLAMLPVANPPPHPVCHVVGATGPATADLVAAVALVCLEVAQHVHL